MPESNKYLPTTHVEPAIYLVDEDFHFEFTQKHHPSQDLMRPVSPLTLEERLLFTIFRLGLRKLRDNQFMCNHQKG